MRQDSRQRHRRQRNALALYGPVLLLALYLGVLLLAAADPVLAADADRAGNAVSSLVADDDDGVDDGALLFTFCWCLPALCLWLPRTVRARANPRPGLGRSQRARGPPRQALLLT